MSGGGDLADTARRVEATRALASRLSDMCAEGLAGEESQVMRATVWRALVLSYRQALLVLPSGTFVRALDGSDRDVHEALLRDAELCAAGRAPLPLRASADEGRQADAAARLCDHLLVQVNAEADLGEGRACAPARAP